MKGYSVEEMLDSIGKVPYTVTLSYDFRGKRKIEEREVDGRSLAQVLLEVDTIQFQLYRCKKKNWVFEIKNKIPFGIKEYYKEEAASEEMD